MSRLFAAGILVIFGAVLSLPAAADSSAYGVPLDAPWKVKIYAMVHDRFKHPAWGWQHSVRNYRLALVLARGDGLKVDSDVLFAAAFLHDMAAFESDAPKNVEHGEVAAERSGALLQAAGFPMSKLPAVQAAERGHMYYSNPGSQPEAIVLHDADSLDFLGSIGAARMIALTGADAASFAPAVKQLRAFIRDIPPHLVTRTAQRIGKQRVAELKRFLDQLDAETFNGSVM